MMNEFRWLIISDYFRRDYFFQTISILNFELRTGYNVDNAHCLHWSRRIEYPFILSSIPYRCDRVLDIGCADTPLPFILLSNKVDAIDIDNFFIQSSNNRKKLLNNDNVEFSCYDASNLPYENKIFNVVTCVSTMEHMDFNTFKSSLKEINRVLVDDGIFLLTIDVVPKTEEYLKYLEKLYGLDTSVGRDTAFMPSTFDLPYIGIIMMKLDKLEKCFSDNNEL